MMTAEAPADAGPRVPPPEPLTAEEAEAVDSLRRELGDDLKPGSQAARFCSPSSLCRYLRARSWAVPKALKMLRNSLQWRERSMPEGPESLRWDDVIHAEGCTGKMIQLPAEIVKTGQPALLMSPRRENTKSHDGQIGFLVYNLETAIAATRGRPDEQRGSGSDRRPEQLIIVIDFKGYSVWNAPPMKTSRETLSILQDQYPERLGRAFLLNTPGIFGAFWKLISPLIDPVTFQKIQFVKTKRGKDGKVASDHEVYSETFDLGRLTDILESEVGTGPAPFNADAYAERMRTRDAERAAAGAAA